MGEAKPNLAVAQSGSRRLAEAVRAAKIAGAQRTDVVVDIREADRARLEIFAEELQPIVDAIPADDDLFDFYLSGGQQPRFWIDGTAQVMMARDRRTYQLVRETRLGRQTLAESSDPRILAERVTDYVAERIVERDRAFALDDDMPARLSTRAAIRHSSDDPIPAQRAREKRSIGMGLALMMLLLGVGLGMALLGAYAAFTGTSLV